MLGRRGERINGEPRLERLDDKALKQIERFLNDMLGLGPDSHLRVEVILDSEFIDANLFIGDRFLQRLGYIDAPDFDLDCKYYLSDLQNQLFEIFHPTFKDYERKLLDAKAASDVERPISPNEELSWMNTDFFELLLLRLKEFYKQYEKFEVKIDEDGYLLVVLGNEGEVRDFKFSKDSLNKINSGLESIKQAYRNESTNLNDVDVNSMIVGLGVEAVFNLILWQMNYIKGNN